MKGWWYGESLGGGMKSSCRRVGWNRCGLRRTGWGNGAGRESDRNLNVNAQMGERMEEAESPPGGDGRLGVPGVARRPGERRQLGENRRFWALGFARFGLSRCGRGRRARPVGGLEEDAIARLSLGGGEAVQGQKESTGSESIDGWNVVVRSELDAVDDAILVVEIDEVVGREPGDGRDALEGVEPEACVGVGGQSFDQDLDGL